MESLEPVAHVAAAAEAAVRRTPEAEGAEARAAELVHAAEGQVTELRRRLEATSELLRAAESEAASSQQMVAAREAEAARLLETLGGEGAGGQAEGHALKQAEGREQQQQLDFLNQQARPAACTKGRVRLRAGRAEGGAGRGRGGQREPRPAWGRGPRRGRPGRG